MKKVSIVLPVFNGEEHLAEAIDSVLAQTYENLELIVVDDCSTDKTPQIVSDFAQKDKRVKVIQNKVNQRLPKSLNIGFSHADGEYLTWTSDDNLYKPNAIEEMADYLGNHAGVDMVYCDYTIIDENGAKKKDNILEESERLIWTNTVGACFLYRREVAEKVGNYNSEMFLAEDYDYWLRIYQAGTIKHLPRNLYCYRHHSKSLTATRQEQIKHQTVLLFLVHWKFISKKLKGIRTKLHYCDMILNMEAEEYRKKTFRELRKRVPLYGIYKALGKG